MNDSAPNKLSEGYSKFRVLNIAKNKKTIKIFNCRIPYLKERNLLDIPGIDESDIRASLLKGEIRNKILVGEISILENDVDLLQFNDKQKQFLTDIGIIDGLGIKSEQFVGNISIDRVEGDIDTSRLVGNLDVSRIDGNRDSTCYWDLNGNGDFTTWEEVYAFIQSVTRPIHIILSRNQNYNIPASGGVYDLKNAVIEAPLGDASGCTINIEDGATLLDLSQGQGAFTLIGNSTNLSTPAIDFSTFSSGIGIYLQQFGNYLRNNGSSPMIHVPDNAFFVLAARYGGGIDSSNVSTAIRAENNCVLLLTTIGSPISLPTDSISGPGSTNIIFQQDGSMISPEELNLPNFSGTYLNAPFGNNAGRGPTSFRPLGLFGPITTGTFYYDTKLSPKIPIWYDKDFDKWYDANGVAV